MVLIVCFFICFTYINAEPALPSYELEPGEWPEGIDKADKKVENLMDRWFIDKKDAKCKPFEYYGTKGNFNNFPSQKLCERHLNAKLTQVEKLQGCELTSINNEHHGACTENTNGKVQKFYFDKNQGTCTQFDYNGCGGTFNRYDSDDECKAYCLNSKNGKVGDTLLSTKLRESDNSKYTLPNYLDCHLKPDVKIPNPETKVIALINKKKCVYSSVDNVLGRGYFETFRDCVAKSHFENDPKTATDKPEEMRKVAACNSDQPYQYASKSGSTDLIKYYYHKSEEKCKRFETGPASSSSDDFDETKNNFPTLDLCHSYCGTKTYNEEITTEKTCQEQKKGHQSTGTNGAFQVTRYYYLEENNGAVKKCKAFTYYGLGGNTNNFKTSDECIKICGKNMRPNDNIDVDNNPNS